MRAQLCNALLLPLPQPSPCGGAFKSFETSSSYTPCPCRCHRCAARTIGSAQRVAPPPGAAAAWGRSTRDLGDVTRREVAAAPAPAAAATAAEAVGARSRAGGARSESPVPLPSPTLLLPGALTIRSAGASAVSSARAPSLAPSPVPALLPPRLSALASCRARACARQRHLVTTGILQLRMLSMVRGLKVRSRK
jgi:hypothetical protein